MSIVIQRMPLQTISMNRLPEAKRDDEMTTVTMTQASKRKKDYDQESDGFVFTKNKRVKPSREPSAQPEREPTTQQSARETLPRDLPAQRHIRDTLTRSEKDASEDTAQINGDAPASRRARTPSRQDERHVRQQATNGEPYTNKRRLPRTPDAETRGAAKERIGSPKKTVTVEKRRKHGTSRILLPASDTPVIRRNKAMRETMNERRRSSSGMRGRRASSMMEEGRWNAQPHPEVPAADFYTMITSDLTEPRRMRLLLGWCGDRALPKKPQPPSSSSKQASEEFQALQAARIIQEEISKEFSTNAVLSEWFSRDTEVPQPIILHKRPNPRNILNAAKVQELEKELQKLQSERSAWERLISEATSYPEAADRAVSPPNVDLLSPSQQQILAQLQASDLDQSSIEKQLHEVSGCIEFVMDQLSQSVNAVTVATDVTQRVADKSLVSAAKSLTARDPSLTGQESMTKVDALDALRGLARILNAPKS